MPIVIPPEFQPFVAGGIASGRFRSEEEAVREGLDLLRSREQKPEALRADLQVGLDDPDAGRSFPLDIEQIKQRGRQRLREAGAMDECRRSTRRKPLVSICSTFGLTSRRITQRRQTVFLTAFRLGAFPARISQPSASRVRTLAETFAVFPSKDMCGCAANCHTLSR